jgi:AcrR family transcriptional regulator
MTTRRTRSDGERSRDTILDAAAELATVEGLDGLSLGRLAEVTGMSKSGVFGLFGSKEELQLATIDKARHVFITEVIGPALNASPGRDQLVALCVGYLDHVERRVFPGGCFFASVASEVSSRPGPVRDRVADEQKQWTSLLTENAKQAIEAGELAADTDPEQLTLELSTMLTGADIAYLLHEDPTILAVIRSTIRTKLEL